MSETTDERSEFEYTPVTVAGKTAVVVGGTSGIGRGIALAFAEEGANVVATSRTDSRVAATAEEIRERGAEALEVTCDVTDRASLDELVERTVDRFGGVDVLVNSPSAIARSSVRDVTDEEFEHVLDVQLTGVHRTVQAFVTAADPESVVSIASLSSQQGMTDLAAYASAKGGIDGYTRAAAKDLGPEIRVNAIRPGFITTEQTADTYAEGSYRYERIMERASAERMGRPEDIAGAAVYLASDAAAYVTGEIVVVDGGFSTSSF
ncbi:SDR family NAD(P)-dependent oxidoreductase [Halopenitus sp. H-Gu1]|uniref:SDR family NAD(P)-dependent oxidoreductase n=1 Tax=Halopenitus sp. H-Gu1 TaxID=3242697 RepID=UPI00359E1291